MIDASYNCYNYPPQIVSVFGNKSGVSLFNKEVTNLESLLKLCTTKLKKGLSTKDSNTLKLIQNQNDILFDQIHTAYLEARNT